MATNSINAYVLGEHGDSQFVAWSLASIDDVPIDKALPPDTLNRTELAKECKHEGQRIIEAKGAISFGIGSVVSSVCSSILFDKRNVYPISHFQPDLDCCLSLPVVLGRKGIIKTISLPLNSEEKARLVGSGKKLREMVHRLTDDI
jgi:L-lactate dehydrogenase